MEKNIKIGIYQPSVVAREIVMLKKCTKIHKDKKNKVKKFEPFGEKTPCKRYPSCLLDNSDISYIKILIIN